MSPRDQWSWHWSPLAFLTTLSKAHRYPPWESCKSWILAWGDCYARRQVQSWSRLPCLLLCGILRRQYLRHNMNCRTTVKRGGYAPHPPIASSDSTLYLPPTMNAILIFKQCQRGWAHCRRWREALLIVKVRYKSWTEWTELKRRTWQNVTCVGPFCWLSTRRGTPNDSKLVIFVSDQRSCKSIYMKNRSVLEAFKNFFDEHVFAVRLGPSKSPDYW